MSKVRGGDERNYPASEVRGGGREEIPHAPTYKKDLHDPGNHDGVITDLEPDILECEVKWALEIITTNKASGGDGIPVSYCKS